MVAYPGWRLPAEDCDALRLRRLVAFGSRAQRWIQHGQLRAAKVADFVSANKKRQPIGYRNSLLACFRRYRVKLDSVQSLTNG